MLTLGLVVAGAAAVTVGHGEVAAGQNQLFTLSGVERCDTELNAHFIDWTFSNASLAGVAIASAVVDANGLTGGSAIDTSASFSPTSLSAGQNANATTEVSNDAAGDYHLAVNFTPEGSSSQFLDQLVVLTSCVVATTPPSTSAPSSSSSSSSQPSTSTPTSVVVTSEPGTVASTMPGSVETTAAATTPATEAPAASSTDTAGAGGLPHTGGSSTGMAIAATSAIALGLVLLRLRARHLPN